MADIQDLKNNTTVARNLMRARNEYKASRRTSCRTPSSVWTTSSTRRSRPGSWRPMPR